MIFITAIVLAGLGKTCSETICHPFVAHSVDKNQMDIIQLI